MENANIQFLGGTLCITVLGRLVIFMLSVGENRMNKQKDYCIAIEYRFTVGHEDWKILGKDLSHLLSLFWLFHRNLTFFSKVVYRLCFPILASCYRCWKLACREMKQPECLLLNSSVS